MQHKALSVPGANEYTRGLQVVEYQLPHGDNEPFKVNSGICTQTLLRMYYSTPLLPSRQTTIGRTAQIGGNKV